MTPKQAAKIYARTCRIHAVMRASRCDFYNAKRLILAGGGVLRPRRYKSRLSKTKIIALYATMGIADIATINGTSANIIFRVLHAAGVKMRPRGGGADDRAIVHGYCRRAAELGMTSDRFIRLAAVMKLGGRCVRCGIDDLRILDLNHIDGQHATNRAGRRRVRYQQQLAILCGNVPDYIEVRCANCNRIHEYERGNHQALPDNLREILCNL